MHPVVLVIDDQWGRLEDPFILDTYGKLPVSWILESAEKKSGHYSVEAALRSVRNHTPNVILLDINFGQHNERLGVDILQAIRADFPTVPVLMFTSLDSEEHRELVIRCMELGANEYLEKAPSAERMHEILSVYTNHGLDQALYGNSFKIRQLRAKIARVAFSGEASVLIVGESGTGKELVARGLHRQGPRKRGKFVPKNCAYSDLQLLGSELFGHERGAFTGAVEQHQGLIEEADGGVLFLDEIADMPLELQGKLLRILETRTFRRVGGVKDIESKFQLIGATNQSPEELLKSGRLREDFYYRIATMTLHVPPLREHIDDAPILAEWFLKRFKSGGGESYPGQKFSTAFFACLLEHAWPGNIRELRNLVERSVILSKEALIGAEELPEPFASTTFASCVDDCGASTGGLPENPKDWPQVRLAAELRLAVEARLRVQAYKGKQWKAEFMRLMYPDCKAANAKGFDDLIKRLTQGPWGCPNWLDNPDIVELIETLRH